MECVGGLDGLQVPRDMRATWCFQVRKDIRTVGGLELFGQGNLVNEFHSKFSSYTRYRYQW